MGNIVWLASYPKSGNTWLRAFLANLVANRFDPVSLNELSHYCDDDANPDLFGALAGRSSAGMSIDEIAVLRPQVHAAIAARAQGTRFVKTHNMTGSFNGHALHNWPVSAGAIYVVRNPLDVAVSMTHHFGIGLDEAIDRLGNENVATANDALFVTQILGSWSLHVSGWADLASDRILVLRYEDLIEKPLKPFTKIAKLVGLGQDRVRIERAIKHAGFQSLSSMEKKHGFVEASDKAGRFFRKGRINEWREVLSREQAQRVIDAHREQMLRFGYVPTGY
ncbi:MAG: sulfotransferase domain-containing protein [Dokdonella sp.]